MPLPSPVLNDPRFGYGLTAIVQQLQSAAAQAAMLKTSALSGVISDRYGNAIEVWGSNLSTTVTIGATFNTSANTPVNGIAKGPIAGVEVVPYPPATQSVAPTAGRAYPQGVTFGMLKTTAGDTVVTMVSTSAGQWAVGQTIGASAVIDPDSDWPDVMPPPTITPGTTVVSVSGSTITLSRVAAASGTFYGAACTWLLAGG